MKKLASIQQLLMRSRRMPWLVVALTLAILGGTIFVARQQLRSKVRDQIVGRDAEVLHAVAQMYLDETAKDDTAPDVGQQIFVMLKTSKLGGVMGARLFDAGGRFVEAFDKDVLEADANPADLPLLRKLRPVSRFYPAVRLSENFFLSDRKGADPVAPLLEVNVPMHARKSSRLLGVAQFLIEGESIAAEFARLDQHLTRQALAAFGVIGVILIVTLGWAFRRLHHAHEMLAARNHQLLQANQELSLAARTSALGAVSAHLIHGLKNPLSGLQSFVANRSADTQTDEDWEQAVTSTRRMQSMINEVVNVMREEESGARYEVTLAELAELVTARMQPLARETSVTITVRRDSEAVLPNRTANLVALVLVNLVQNSLQSTPAGKSVCLHFAETDEHLVCEVRDEGPGLPDELRQNLFAPCRSTRKGGSGIGLAISKQLANHLGAGLELKSSTSRGCIFALTLPLALCVGRSPMESVVRA
ncbi:MAG TPA: HAMP domain-containing sensor histidine kinase [Methylomirabilota bacterium]|nr:HAMP domain-containing sensor histidine kinase [Methylomirabilota bacterium]